MPWVVPVAEVVGGAVDAVCVVVDVCFTVAVSVDAVGGEGGGHELHESFGAGAAGGVWRPWLVSAMPIPARRGHGS